MSLRLPWLALFVACAPVPPTTPQPMTRVAEAVVAPIAAPSATPPTPAAAPATPAAPRCTTIPIASTWKPPVSEARPFELVKEPRVSVRGRAVVKLVTGALARRCPTLDPPDFSDLDDSDDQGATWLGAQAIGSTALTLHEIVSGNGVTAEYGVTVTHHDLVACTTNTLEIGYYDAALAGYVLDSPPTSLLTQFIGPEYDPGDPAHAYATLLRTTGACVPDEAPDLADDAPRGGAPDLELLPLPFGDQPWFPGRPRPQARVWRRVQEVDEQTGDRIGAVVVEPPVRLRSLRAIDDLEIFGADMPGRNGGLALALYDRRGDRHRWLLYSRGCLQGTSIYWLAAGSGLVIGYAVSGHPVYEEEGRGGLFALDLTHARVYRVLLSGASLLWELPEAQGQDGRLTPGQPPPTPGDVGEPVFDPGARQIGRLRHDPGALRTRCGALVPVSAIRAAIDAGVPTPPRAAEPSP